MPGNVAIQSILQIMLHEPSEYPSIDSNGFVVQPGTVNFVSIKLSKTSSLPKPYQDSYCWEKPKQLKVFLNIFAFVKPQEKVAYITVNSYFVWPGLIWKYVPVLVSQSIDGNTDPTWEIFKYKVYLFMGGQCIFARDLSSCPFRAKLSSVWHRLFTYGWLPQHWRKKKITRWNFLKGHALHWPNECSFDTVYSKSNSEFFCGPLGEVGQKFTWSIMLMGILYMLNFFR